MQPMRLVGAMGLLVVLGFAGAVIGCGQGTPQGSTAEDKERGNIIKEGKQRFYKQLKESAKKDAAAHGRAKRRGH